MVHNPQLERSEALTQIIRHAINQIPNQRMSFAHFMELALFHSSLGYYQASENILGAAGDFTTAPEISPLFSRCLAHYCEIILTAWPAGQATILEIGAGTGKMAAHLLLNLESLNCLPKRYQIVERSTLRLAQQKDNLNRWIPHLIHRIDFLDALPTRPIQGIILANEVLDVLPVHCFCLVQGQLQERYVSWDAMSGFIWQTGPLSSMQLAQQLHAIHTKYFKLVDNYQSEICLAVETWLADLSQCLHKGYMILIDYGSPAQEYYHPQRDTGTLRCYFQHRSYHNPLQHIGLQDITSHVNFTQVATSAVGQGLQLEAFASQANFLIKTGLLNSPELCYNNKNYLMTKGQVHQMTSPIEMGELSKVMVLSRHMHNPSLSLGTYDRRTSL